jgi:glutamate racemase
MHRAAIGVFDSGIGGLTVAAEIARRLPHEDLIYLGDTARLPYGTRSPATVVRYAERAVGLLLRYPIKALVVACNTASAYALDALREGTELPVLGVIGPGARAALAATTSGRIGVAGTEGTIRSDSYQRAITARRADAQITAMAWPLLVPLAEEGWTDHEVSRLTLETYLGPFVDAGVDTIVLGCTHYPPFAPLVQRVLAERFDRRDVALVDSAQAVTDDLEQLLAERELAAPERTGRRSFFCTDAPDRFRRVGRSFFDGDLSTVMTVDL